MKPLTLTHILAWVALVDCDVGDNRPLGAICGNDQECSSGLCVEGRCLDPSARCYASQRRCTSAGSSEECIAPGKWVLKQDCEAEGLACIAGSCRSPCAIDPKYHNSNSGCDYWAVDMDNHYGAENGPFAVIISNLSEREADVFVTRKDDAGSQLAEVLHRELAPGELSILDLPNRNMGTAGIFWSAYRIQSTSAIIAYQFNPLHNVDVFSNGASLLISANTLGTEYFIMSRFEFLGGGPTPDSLVPYRGEFSVVAGGTHTNVTVVPTCRTQAGANLQAMVPLQSYTYTIDPYQVLNVKSDEDLGDLTGSLVLSDKPVAVFSGHEAAISSDRCCADHLEHQMFPVSTWGNEYVAARSYPRQVEKDYWRIIAAENDTTVELSPPVEGVNARTINRGQWFEIVTGEDFVVTADKPIAVGQLLASSHEVVEPAPFSECATDYVCAPGYTCQFDFFTSTCLAPPCTPGLPTCPAGHVCTTYDDGHSSCAPIGDPELIMVPPTKQFRDYYVFLSPNNYAFDYINIVAPSDASVALDGREVPPGDFTAIASLGWKVARISVADGIHRLLASQPVGVIAYGYDRDVSYGYAAGLNLVE